MTPFSGSVYRMAKYVFYFILFFIFYLRKKVAMEIGHTRLQSWERRIFAVPIMGECLNSFGFPVFVGGWMASKKEVVGSNEVSHHPVLTKCFRIG
jgi:hypothetical protein